MTTTPGSSTPARRKVVILGGGVGGITAAFELSRAGWQEHFESITLYQQGWRLGGKGASGRGVDDRIEEHGLHLWLGYYENSFRMLRECYEELHRPPGEPLATIEQAFERASHFTVLERRPDGWLPWRASFPEDAGMPGDPAARLPSLYRHPPRRDRTARRHPARSGLVVDRSPQRGADTAAKRAR